MFRLLIVNIILLAIPLFLELFVFLPLLYFHAIGGEDFWVLAKAIGVATGVAAVFTIAMASSILLGAKKYITDATTKTLSRWVIGLASVFVLLIFVVLCVYLISNR